MRIRAIPCLLVLTACSPATPRDEQQPPSAPAEAWTLESVTPDTTDGVRILVIHDMEGLSGQTDPKTYFFGEKEYSQGQEMLVGDINAVIEGLTNKQPKTLVEALADMGYHLSPGPVDVEHANPNRSRGVTPIISSPKVKPTERAGDTPDENKI